MPPFTSTTAEARRELYLKEMGQDVDETLHVFRSGCLITLALSGVELKKNRNYGSHWLES